MKIIHLGNIPIPKRCQDKYGGVTTHPGRWVLNHAIAQKNAGMDVEIVTQAHKANADFTEIVEGVKVHFLRTFHPYRHLTFYAIDSYRMARYVRSLNPDIVHAHGTEAAYALAAIRSKLPFCVTAQGLFFQILPTLSSGFHLNERFIRVSEHWALKRTRYMIAKSEYVKKALSDRYSHLDIHLIPNTYQKVLEEPIIHKSNCDIVFVGTVDERKGIHLIADAMPKIKARFPQVRFHIAGNAPNPLSNASSYSSEVIGKLTDILGDNLVLHGRVCATDLFKILDQCRILVAPSKEEMFGNQLIEGLMRGCHGIVTENTALAENARRFGNATVVPQCDSDAIAATIIQNLSQPFDMAEAISARKKIMEYMSPDVVARKHYELYKYLIRTES